MKITAVTPFILHVPVTGAGTTPTAQARSAYRRPLD
jgi:hypothetical protein